MNWKIVVACGLLLMAPYVTASENKCRSYMIVSALYDAAAKADYELSSWKSNATEATKAAAFSAHMDARRAREDAATAVRSIIEDENIATAIDAIDSTLVLCP